MYIKSNILPQSFERQPIGRRPGSGEVGRFADTKPPFSSILHGLITETGQSSGMQDQSIPLDSKTVQELIAKINERMNNCLLSLAAGEERYDGIGSLLCEEKHIDSASEHVASRNRRIEPENDKKTKMDELDRIIAEAADAFGVDRDLVRSVVRVESGFTVSSTSPKGAMGLMQLMPDTARELGVKNSFDPVENIMGGTRYLRKLLDRYHGDIRLALASYNWGMGNVERNPDRLPPETSNYISRVLKHYGKAKTSIWS